MSEDGLHVEFEPARAKWKAPSGLALPNNKQISGAYYRASSFLRERAAALKADTKLGWRDGDLGHKNMISMIRPLGKRPAPGSRPKVLILPSYFEEFLAVRLSSKRTAAWQNRFSGYTVKRRGAKADDMYVDEPAPLADILYMLQCIAPGMLQLTPKDHDEKTHIRSIPSDNWIIANKDALILILGDERRVTALLKASSIVPAPVPSDSKTGPATSALPTSSADRALTSTKQTSKQEPAPSSTGKKPAPKKAPKSTHTAGRARFTNASWTSSLSDSDSNAEDGYYGQRDRDFGFGDPYASEDLDWGACDKDCAWCGRCIYSWKIQRQLR
ncbi:hypothetical protein BDV98DRAFT_658414 [Pterulicium gracile]|uniref:Uncharacterized protein n=1 Tax=Pterulicium gracile TaxID=1884261 RepID=A0A5C3Q927_9AGAR|nr:hypothetical protein BDV98DRAFT_658414 [Pterula gracilis]